MIYIVEDDAAIRELEQYALQSSGYEVQSFEASEPFWQAMRAAEPELVILDVMLPGEDGFSILKKLRNTPALRRLPIIMVTAKSSELDTVRGLDCGADDYITKPFNAVELTARVNSLIRRYFSLGASDIKTGDLKIGRVSIFDDSKEVRVEDELANLTPYEYKILYLLAKNPGRVFSSNEIYERVWEEEAIDVRKIISVHISHLRDKIEINPRKPDLIKSVYGMGYKIEVK